MVEDIDQVQDNIVIMHRVPVFMITDDINRDTEPYLTTLSVFMRITYLMIRRVHMAEILLHRVKKHTERFE